MRKALLLFFFAFISVSALQAQDIITKRTGEKLEAKVLEISNTEIKYKRFNNLEGPIYVITKAEVLLIQYPDMTTEAFELPVENSLTASTAVDTAPYMRESASAVSESPVQLYQKGENDAMIYYEGYKPAGTAVLVVSLLSPLVGLVPAVGTTVSKPKVQNLQAPNAELLQQPDYLSGYQKRASKIKSGKVWKNWGIALGVNVLAVMVLTNSQ